MVDEAGADDDAAARPALSRAEVIRTAISLMDAEGAAALSMRRLGAEIGVEAMALYRYVDGREDLLDAMVDLVSAPVEDAAGKDVGESGGWRVYLWRLGQQIRRMATDHPHIFPLVATRHPAAPWLRPPLRNLDMVEEFLRTLLQCGFSATQASLVYRTFTSFLLGPLMLTAAELTKATGPADELPGASSRKLSEFPTIVQMGDLLSEPGKDAEEFDDELEALLDRIAAIAGEPTD